KGDDKLLEAQRIEQRTKYDIEMLKEIGFCQGIENYSRHITGRKPGEKPYTLMDFFPDDYLIIIDESHVTVPQVRGMYAGDRSRKASLIDNGRSEEHTSELQSRFDLVCRLLLEKKNSNISKTHRMLRRGKM